MPQLSSLPPDHTIIPISFRLSLLFPVSQRLQNYIILWNYQKWALIFKIILSVINTGQVAAQPAPLS